MRGHITALMLATAATTCVIAAPAFAQVKQFDVPAQQAFTAITALG